MTRTFLPDSRIGTRVIALLAAVAAVMTLYGCGGDDLECNGPFCVSPGPPQASKLEPGGNNPQSGFANRALPPVTVSVKDDKGRPVAGVPVVFTPGQGGVVSKDTVESDNSGTAQVTWTLGPDVGDQSLQATAESEPGSPLEGSPLMLSVQAVAPQPARLVLQTGPSEAAQNGVPFAQQPVLEVLDADGVPIAQAQVAASIASGEGSLSGTTTVGSDATGRATYTDLAIAGPSGPRTIRFTVGNPAQEVTSGIIQVTAGTASEMSGVPPLTYEGTVGSPVTPPPSVLLKDAAGNPVPGVAVSFVPDRDAAVSPTTVVSDERGIAQVTSWTLGTTANVQYSLSATVPSSTLTPIVFTATSRAGAAGRLQILTQPSASAQNGARFPVQPVIQVTDQNGNPAPQQNLRITATVSSGSGTLSNAVATTDGSGRAAFTGLTITGKVGSYAISFSARGLAGVTSSAVALVPGAANRLALISGPLAARSRFPLTPQPAVQVQDVSGNPVPQAGIPVVASMTGGARLGGTTTVTTNGDGVAAYNDLSITGPPGPQTLSFSAPELGGASTGVSLPGVSSIEVSEPVPGSAVVGSQVSAPSWVLKDANGETVSDVPVAVTASPGGSVVASTGSGDGGGVQVDTWTLGTAAGDQFVQITVTGTSLSNTVHIQATAAPPFILEKISGDGQTDTVNTQLDSLLVVRLIDQFGNGVSGVAVQWRTCDGGGNYDDVTGTEGYSSATQDTGSEPGTFCTRASASGFTVDFTYTVVPGSSTSSALRAGLKSAGPAPSAPRTSLRRPATR